MDCLAIRAEEKLSGTADLRRSTAEQNTMLSRDNCDFLLLAAVRVLFVRNLSHHKLR